MREAAAIFNIFVIYRLNPLRQPPKSENSPREKEKPLEKIANPTREEKY